MDLDVKFFFQKCEQWIFGQFVDSDVVTGIPRWHLDITLIILMW